MAIIIAVVGKTDRSSPTYCHNGHAAGYCENAFGTEKTRTGTQGRRRKTHVPGIDQLSSLFSIRYWIGYGRSVVFRRPCPESGGIFNHGTRTAIESECGEAANNRSIVIGGEKL